MAGRDKTGGPRKGRGLTRLEEQLWKTAMRDVQPHVDQPAEPDPFVEALAAPMQAVAPSKNVAATSKTDLLPKVSFGLKPVQAPSIGKGLDRNTAQKLSRGQMTIDAKLDLHDLRYDQAKYALERFIDMAYHAQKRCVLVITGQGQAHKDKGASLKDRPWYEPTSGVLKRHLPVWLAQPSMAAKIIAVEPAQQRHGGEGAVYILLRRIRPS